MPVRVAVGCAMVRTDGPEGPLRMPSATRAAHGHSRKWAAHGKFLFGKFLFGKFLFGEFLFGKPLFGELIFGSNLLAGYGSI
jgi:hypothetical protein